jgi:hypothetical protein
MFLQRYKPQTEQKDGNDIQPKVSYTQENVIELYIEKNRSGSRGKVAFEFKGDLQQFHTITPSEVPVTPPENVQISQPQQERPIPQQAAASAKPKEMPKIDSSFVPNVPTSEVPFDMGDIFSESDGESSSYSYDDIAAPDGSLNI